MPEQQATGLGSACRPAKVLEGGVSQTWLVSPVLTNSCGLCVVQVSIPLWALVHLPVVVTITTAVFTPTVRICHFLLQHLLDEHVTSHILLIIHEFHAAPEDGHQAEVCMHVTWLSSATCRAGCTASSTCSSRTPWAL